MRMKRMMIFSCLLWLCAFAGMAQKFALIDLGAWLRESWMFVNLVGSPKVEKHAEGEEITEDIQYSESIWGDG